MRAQAQAAGREKREIAQARRTLPVYTAMAALLMEQMVLP
jgi:hypothetical protein